MLDEDHFVIALFGTYNDENNRLSGHACIIYDYENIDGVIKYVVYDPLHVNEGKILKMEYNELSRRDDSITGGERYYICWESIVVYQTGSFSDTINWIGCY